MKGVTPIDLLDLMEARKYPFRLARSALRDSDLFTAQGWAPLKDKFEELDGDDEKEAAESLLEINRQLLLYAEKVVAFYPLTSIEAKRVLAIMNGLHSKNVYALAYPFLLPAKELASQGAGLRFAALEEEANLVHAVLATRTSRTVREQIDVADFPTIPTLLKGFDQVIAMRRDYSQVFHIVTVRELTQGWVLEIRVDGTGHVVAEDFGRHLAVVRDWVEKEYEKAFNGKFQSKDQLNIFPAIEKLYAEKAGRVRQLGGTTTTSSVKQERMRRRSDDLREEKFHVAGQGAAKVKGFSIEKVWDSPSGNASPTLIVPGRLMDGASQAPVVRYCLIKNCATQADYNLVFTKLTNALGL